MNLATKRAASLCGILGLAALAGGCAGNRVEPDLLLDGVTVIDATGSSPLPDRAVAIREGRILSIGPAGSVTAGASTTVIDARGKHLIPGLWDMHVHLMGYDEHAFPLFLANGVTTIRDMGDDLATMVRLREGIRSGRLQGPDLLIAGPILDAPYLVRAVQGTRYQVGRQAVADSAEGVFWVDSLHRVGVDHLKVHSATPRAAYFAILQRAKQYGIPVGGHLPDSVMPREAIEAGQRTIEHNWRLDLATSSRAEAIARWQLAAIQAALGSGRPGQVGVVRLAAADSGLASFDAEVAREFAAWAATREVWFDPTLIVIQAFLGVDEAADSAELRYVPRVARLVESVPATITPEERRQKYRAIRTTIDALVQGGARMITGTDVPVMPLVPGFALHREMELLVEAGLTPLQALQAATRNAALAAGRGGEVGTIEPGKRADLVLLDADPLANIANTRRIQAVILRGKLLDRSALDRMLADAATYAREHCPSVQQLSGSNQQMSS